MKLLMALSLSYLAYNFVELMITLIYRKYFVFKNRLDIIESQSIIGFKGASKKDKKKGNLKLTVPEKLTDSLLQAGLLIKAEEYIIIWLVSGLLPGLIGVILGLNTMLCILLMGGGFILPAVVLSMKKKKRGDKFNNQLGDALMIISNSLRAGFTFEQALKSVSRDLPDPIGTEFRKIVREVDLGERLEVAMEEVAIRMNSDDMGLMNTAVAIQRQVGGNLADVLDNIGETIRARIIMKKNIKAMTAQGEISGKVIALLPVILLVMISFVNGEYMEPMFNTTFGHVLLGVSFILELLGYMMIKKLINIEV